MAGVCMLAMNGPAPAPSGSSVIYGINSAISALINGASSTPAGRSIIVLLMPYSARALADAIASSTKIAADRRQAAQQVRHVDQPLGDQMTHDALLLPYAVDAEQRRAQHFAALLLDQRRPDDDVDIAGLVLQRDEDHALGRAGSLPYRDHAAAARQLAVLVGVERGGRHEAVFQQLLAQQRQRMAAQRQPQRAIVAEDVLAFRRRAQLRHLLIRRGRAQQVLVGHGADGLPQCLASVAGQMAQRVGAG